MLTWEGCWRDVDMAQQLKPATKRLPNSEGAFIIQVNSQSLLVPVASRNQSRASRTLPKAHEPLILLSSINKIATSQRIFTENIRPLTLNFDPPKMDEPLTSALQLACCLSLLQKSHSPDDVLEPTAENWLKVGEKDTDEQELLYSMATEVIRMFIRDEFKDAKVVTEVVYLVPVQERCLSRPAKRALLWNRQIGLVERASIGWHRSIDPRRRTRIPRCR
ncbi:hypothetical protein B0O80DRAFT_87322 [Mortierella sp. GBAus27b]|nr:hypothetical protein B0O80DRAFT_87322 [Mortierella sp. GBAus27b]